MLTDTACRNAGHAEKPCKLADANGLYLYVTPNIHHSCGSEHPGDGRLPEIPGR